jgi:hypothetical protein
VKPAETPEKPGKNAENLGAIEDGALERNRLVTRAMGTFGDG